MKIIQTRTYTASEKNLTPRWRVIDASGRTLGRLATEIACILRGKDKPTFTPHIAMGDFVVVVNAAKVHVTGAKLTKKFYYHHSLYPGGLKKTRLDDVLAKHPERVIEDAVQGMLPHNALGRRLIKRLKVSSGPDHHYQAQVAPARAAKDAAAPAKDAIAPAKDAIAPAKERTTSAAKKTAAPEKKEA